MREKVDWNEIETFLAVASAGSLSAAARQMGASQPTLGRRLTKLEDELGFVLFDKSRRGYKLTGIGASLMEAARSVNDAHDVFARELNAVKATATPTVRICAGEWMSRLIAGWLPELDAVMPKGGVLLETGPRPPDDRIRATDIIIRHGPAERHAFVVRHLGRTPYAVFGSSDYVSRNPASLSALRYKDCNWAMISCVLPNGETETGRLQWGYPTLGPTARTFLCTSVHSMIELVRAGRALAFLPTFAGHEIGLIQVSDHIQSLEHDYWLTYRNDTRIQPYVKAVARVLGRLVGQHLAKSNLQ